jgi:group I intron endonuclease
MLYCLASGKAYVGQTIQPLEMRWQQHVRDARNGSLYAVHSAIRKYGSAAFEKTVLAEAHTLDELNALEAYHISVQNTLTPAGYNLTTGGLSFKVSEETKRKLSAAGKGKPKSPEHVARQAAAQKGREISIETRIKMSAAQKERKRLPHSDETKAKIGAARVGKKFPRTKH